MPIVTQQQPTGNALSDANAAVTVDPTQLAAAINSANQSSANVASDCLWPPSGPFTVPILPGLYSQSFQLPCLVTYSEARAVFAVGLIGSGVLIIGWGLSIVAVAAAAPTVLTIAGLRALGGRLGGGGGAGQTAPATTYTGSSPSGTPPPPAPAPAAAPATTPAPPTPAPRTRGPM